MECRTKWPGLFLATLMFGFAGPVWSEAKILAPDTIPGTTKVDAEGVLDIIQNFPEIPIIDTRMRAERASSLARAVLFILQSFMPGNPGKGCRAGVLLL
ncbi:MAG TPA: hypothetical protein VFU39_04200 [Sulfuricaulis sp.]|nr:hypothetical protein [Sulfuricaulis sp.]